MSTLTNIPNGGVTLPYTFDPSTQRPQDITNSNFIVQKQNLIQGKMLTVEFTMSQMEYESKATVLPPAEYIKQKLVHELAELIINNHVEFTKMVDSRNFDYHFKARAFLVPNGDVQILRQSGY